MDGARPAGKALPRPMLRGINLWKEKTETSPPAGGPCSKGPVVSPENQARDGAAAGKPAYRALWLLRVKSGRESVRKPNDICCCRFGFWRPFLDKAQEREDH